MNRLWKTALLGTLAWLAVLAGVAGAGALHPPVIGRMPMDAREFFVAVFTVLVTAWVGLLGGVVLLRMLVRAAGFKGAPRFTELPPVRNTILAVNAVLLFLGGYARYGESRWYVVQHVPVPVPSLAEPIRIVHLTDFHADARFPDEEEIIAAVNAQAPDLVVFTGDALNREGQLPRFRRLLTGVQAAHGKYAVRGNWDEWYWKKLPLFEGTGFKELNGWDSVVIRGTTVHVGGHGYQDDAAWKDVVGKPPATPGLRVFLYHVPSFPEEAATAGMDVYLSGHTHGGQVALPGYGALVTLARHGKRFERGRYSVGRMQLYVSPGLGVEALIPLRLLVRPEVSVLDLGPAR